MCPPPYAEYVRRGRPGGDRPAARAALTLFADGDFRLTNWSPDHRHGSGGVSGSGSWDRGGGGGWGDDRSGDGGGGRGSGADRSSESDAFRAHDDAAPSSVGGRGGVGGVGGGGGAAAAAAFHTVEGSWRPVEGVGVRLRVEARKCAPGFGANKAGDDVGGDGDVDGDGAEGCGSAEAGPGPGLGPGPGSGRSRWVDVTLRARRVGSRRVELYGPLTEGGDPVSFWRRGSGRARTT